MRRQDLMRCFASGGAIALTALTVAACGSSTSGSTSGSTPKPKENIAAFAHRLQVAAASGQCAQLQALGSYFRESPCKAQLAVMRSFKSGASASYGPGAVIDATSSELPKGATFVVAVGKNNQWDILSGDRTNRKTVGTTASDTKGFDRAVNGTIASLRSKNCTAFIKYTRTANNDASQCKQPFASAIAQALTSDPRANPRSLGGNAWYQFYFQTLKGYRSHPKPLYLIWVVGKTNFTGPTVLFPYATLPPSVASSG